ncbi:MAG: patatin-like phospholipase family protein [Acidimicrobiales bacterium]|nr:patatin-like phospholipase family protein [Acidimicrobiales bacterium]
MTAVGLVLGSGGLHGAAQHAGALAALVEATGWDPRTADVVVGTSAGATTAVSLRAGLSAADLHAHYAGTPLSDEGRAIVDRVTTPLDLGGQVTGEPAAEERSGSSSGGPWSWRPANPLLVLRDLCSTARPRPVVALAGLLPTGTRDGSSLSARNTEIHPDPWPDQPTWICTVDLQTGKRVVLGRDDVDVAIGPAVQASAAIPGWFRPVEVDGRRLVDGGVHSTTNADLVAALGLDVVVISSVRTVGGTAGPTDYRGTVARAWHARTLWREVQAIRRRGTAVLVLDPTASDLAARKVLADGSSDRNKHGLSDICEAARVSALARLALPEATRARRLLTSAAETPR